MIYIYSSFTAFIIGVIARCYKKSIGFCGCLPLLIYVALSIINEFIFLTDRGASLWPIDIVIIGPVAFITGIFGALIVITFVKLRKLTEPKEPPN